MELIRWNIFYGMDMSDYFYGLDLLDYFVWNAVGRESSWVCRMWHGLTA